MKEIQKSIYTRPEIGKRLKPLWSFWIMALTGAVGGLLMFRLDNLSSGLSSLLLFVLTLGIMALITVLAYYLIGDSRYPYHKELRLKLEPQCFYYGANSEQQVLAALESGDDKTLAAIKQPVQSQLVLFRYTDAQEQVSYSQLMRIMGEHWEPISDIIVNQKSK